MLPGMMPNTSIPAIVSLAYADGTAQSGHPSYPTVQNGDLLVGYCREGTAWNSPSGWTGQYYTNGAVGFKIADGTESGSVSLTTAAPTKSGIVAFRANRPITTASLENADEDYAGGFSGTSVALDGTTYGTQPKLLLSTHLGSGPVDPVAWDVGSPSEENIASDNNILWQAFLTGATDINATVTQPDSGTWTLTYGLIFNLK